jgi:hypothetical protein
VPYSKPDAATLLEAVVKYLDEELTPTLAGYHRFQSRVAANVIRTVGREICLRAGQAAAERTRLEALLGHDGEVEALNSELADRIRAGAIALDDEALRAHIRQSLSDALAINNPKWLGR